MFFQKKPDQSLPIDIHSHLLPGIDDGVKSMEESMEAIQGLMQLGFKGCVTTPHFYEEFYPNKESEVLSLGEEVAREIEKRSLDFKLIAAGEYFIDSSLLEKVKSGHQLNTFGKHHILVETSFLAKPQIFEEVIFELKTAGYHPVLAHPERYQYLFEQPSLARDWHDQGILMQVTSGSLAGIYGKGPQKLARNFIDMNIVNMLGSDLHTPKQLAGLKAGMTTKHYKKAVKSILLNHSLA
ncbi:MAG: CpsB/CapC family capsule biosynthesis tyrosine phosphatase [Cytophagales bacterium]|nr:CpsB/CapC family capsule biosynthesis tyrosine phosphatase [Cytophagales bacterium]